MIIEHRLIHTNADIWRNSSHNYLEALSLASLAFSRQDTPDSKLFLKINLAACQVGAPDGRERDLIGRLVDSGVSHRGTLLKVQQTEREQKTKCVFYVCVFSVLSFSLNLIWLINWKDRENQLTLNVLAFLPAIVSGGETCLVDFIQPSPT